MCSVLLIYFSNYIKFSGGENGQKGENILIKCDGRKIRLGAKTAVDMNPGVSSIHFLDIYIV